MIAEKDEQYKQMYNSWQGACSFEEEFFVELQAAKAELAQLKHDLIEADLDSCYNAKRLTVDFLQNKIRFYTGEFGVDEETVVAVA